MIEYKLSSDKPTDFLDVPAPAEPRAFVESLCLIGLRNLSFSPSTPLFHPHIGGQVFKSLHLHHVLCEKKRRKNSFSCNSLSLLFLCFWKSWRKKVKFKKQTKKREIFKKCKWLETEGAAVACRRFFSRLLFLHIAMENVPFWMSVTLARRTATNTS